MHSLHHVPTAHSIITQVELNFIMVPIQKACPNIIQISNYFHSNMFDLEFVRNSLLIMLDQITVQSYTDNYVYFAQQWSSQVIQLSLINEFLGNVLITAMKL